MNDIEDALKLLVENGYSVTPPEDEIVYLVDHGRSSPMTTRRTLKPTKGWNNKISAQRVALIKLKELDWIEIKEQDFNQEANK
jgi:hypothetical protein